MMMSWYLYCGEWKNNTKGTRRVIFKRPDSIQFNCRGVGYMDKRNSQRLKYAIVQEMGKSQLIFVFW